MYVCTRHACIHVSGDVLQDALMRAMLVNSWAVVKARGLSAAGWQQELEWQ